MFRHTVESSNNKPFIDWKLGLLSFSLTIALFTVIFSDIFSILQSVLEAGAVFFWSKIPFFSRLQTGTFLPCLC